MRGVLSVNANPKNVITWTLIISVPFVGVAILKLIFDYFEPGLVVDIVKAHFAATIGLPMAALLSAFIVVALRHSKGPIKFEGLGFKFEGSSGQVILWVICFLSITVAIRLLWTLS